MKRTHYLLKDMTGSVQAWLTSPDGEDVTLAPWMIHNIQHRSWRLEAWETTSAGVEIHGWVDWKKVADNFASVISLMLEDGREADEEADEQLLAQAQSALDDYHVAQMEISVAETRTDDGGDEDGQPART